MMAFLPHGEDCIKMIFHPKRRIFCFAADTAPSLSAIRKIISNLLSLSCFPITVFGFCQINT